jgi:Kef-type K+ transport system membrane component KefB
VTHSQRSGILYLAFVGLPLAALVVVLRRGQGLSAPPTAATAASPASTGAAPDLLLLLAQIVVVLGTAAVAGRIMRAARQPRVVGEMVAGLVLGPSVLGALLPGVSAILFPPASLGFFGALSQIGLLLFMFLVGLELDLRVLRERGHLAVLTSHASITAPFLLGTALALLLYPRLSHAAVSFTGFALFLGAAMSVTAFPVLARILAERGLVRTRLGAVALACAAVDDVTAWCILAVVVVIVRAASPTVPLWLTVGGTVAYGAFMITVGRRALLALTRRATLADASGQGLGAAVVLLVLGSAWITERLGVHALFGAFLAGAVMPRDPRLVRDVRDRFGDLVVVLFLPLFFAFTGLRTRIDLIRGAELWGWCALIVVVAIAGKVGGSAVAARAGGMSWREATALGLLLNTRGLMELVILNVGLDIGVISPELFAMLVVMALATTLMTTPLLSWVSPATVGEQSVQPRS